MMREGKAKRFTEAVRDWNAGWKRTRDLYLGEIGIDAYAEVIEHPDGTYKLLIKKPSGQAWIKLATYDLIE